MNWSKKLALLAGAMVFAVGAWAQTAPTTNTFTFTLNKNVPQGSPSGLSDTQTINLGSQQLYSITDVQIGLNIQGGFNGDLYAYLVHDDGFAILLNRPGKTAANPTGFSDSGMNITLSTAGTTDIHNYQSVNNPGGGMLTGLFAEDGRNVDPSIVLDTDPRTASLSSMDGQDPSGDWTLFLSDLDYGEQSKLVSWQLVITAVPEPNTLGMLLLGMGGLLALGTWRRGRN